MRDSTDRNWQWVDRRTMLQALGAGSGVALAGGYGRVAAQEGDDGEGDATEECPPCIHRYSGYLRVGQDENGQPEGIDPVATVELRITDAGVVFPDGEGRGPGAGNETGGVGTNETNGGGGNETVSEGANETVGADADEPTAGATGNGTDGPTGNETEGGGPPGGPGGPGGMPDFYFDPVGARLRPGDTVEFLTREGLHTVTAFDPRYGTQQRIPDGAPPFSSPPVVEGDSWYYRFDEPGVYDVLCLPHLSLGMVMRAVVVEDEGEVPEAYPDPETGRPEGGGPEGPGDPGVPPVALQVLNAPELEPQNIVEQETVAWTDLTGVEAEPPTGPPM